MCGIVGVFNLNGETVSESILRNMSEKISHRGPDGEGILCQGPIGLAHRRLAIIDLSDLGRQPMESNDGNFVIIYNGEIYNYQNLRLELESRGHIFRSNTDTEVILNAFSEWNEECVGRLNGMFAFAIWDKRENKIFLARDRYGVKPLYYTFQNQKLIFASEIKSIIAHPDIKVKVCTPALNEYFSFQNIFSDYTLFDGVKLLPAASTATVSLTDRNLRIKPYWDFNFYEKVLFTDEEEYIEELDRLYCQAVERQLVGDVEIGCYLSGGIDSGGITAIASKNLTSLKSFTCGFDLSSATGLELGFDERQKAEFLSNCYKTEHYQVILKAGDMERVMPKLIWHMEDLRVGQSYPNYYVARLASKFVKVVLSGAGGDELFAGYPWRYYKASGSLDVADYSDNYYRYWQRLVDDSKKASFFRPEVNESLRGHSTRDAFRSVLAGKNIVLTSPEEYINCSLYFEAKTFLHGILLVEDKLSMAHGLETRVPFLDNDLVDFASKVPINLKLRSLDAGSRIDENDNSGKSRQFGAPTSDGKLLLRKMLSRYIPDEYSNHAKQGFSAPDASWFKGESIDYIRSLLLNKKARIYDYLRHDTTKVYLDEHFEGKQNRRLLIWSLVCFEWWNRIFDP